MIDFSMDEMLELARQAELQKRVEADMEAAPAPAFPDFCVVETVRSVMDDEGFDIPAGARGTVLDPVAGGARYIVEFADEPYQQRWPGGRTGLATLPPEVMRVVWVPGDPVSPPEDLRGKLGEGDDSQADGQASEVPGWHEDR